MTKPKVFRTVLSPFSSNFKLDYKDSFFFIGSCFSENIGERFRAAKFETTINPFGIQYNPISIFETIHILAEQASFHENDCVESNQRWYHWLHHSDYSAEDKGILMELIQQNAKANIALFKASSTLFITFGTAWVYTFNKQRVVANCHKVPNKHFTKRLLSVDEIEQSFLAIAPLLKNKKVIFTVSPVRHLRDGFHENQLSKATLLLAIEKLKTHLPNAFYFPSYELIIDELRDYRFFNEDMVHPNEQAINYVYDALCESLISNESLTLLEKTKTTLQMLNHKPMHPHSEESKAFKIKLMNELRKRISEGIDFTKELAQLERS